VVAAELTRLDLVVNIRFPGERANGIQVASMAEALAATGLNVDVIVPRRYPYRPIDPFDHYGVPRTFNVHHIASIDAIDLLPVRLQRAPFLLQTVTFGLRALARAAMTRDAGMLVRDHYTLEILVGGLQRADRRRLAAEVHSLPENPARRRKLAATLRQIPAVVTITHALRDDLIGEGLDPERILVAPDGVHVRRFANLPDKALTRGELGLDPRVPLVVYAGQLFPWKGVDTLVEAVGRVKGVQLLIVGGRDDDRARVEALASEVAPGQVTFAGQVAPTAVPRMLAAADVVAVPNSAREEISARYTSPLKLFEAMASRRAILASDLPSLREVLVDGVNAKLVAPDDPQAWADGLAELLSDDGLRQRLVARAWGEVATFDWRARARRVVSFLRERLAVEA